MRDDKRKICRNESGDRYLSNMGTISAAGNQPRVANDRWEIWYACLAF